MKTLSQKLMDYLDDRGITSAALAKSCHIDRSTLYQYLHGSRQLKNADHLNIIMERLSLSLPEREELLKAYQIELIGRERYLRRKKMDKFIRSLPDLKGCTPPPLDQSESLSSPLPNVPSGTLLNRLELSQTIHSLLSAAHQEQSFVEIMMQPQDTSILNQLIHPAFVQSEMNVTHIVCLDRSTVSKEPSHNIDKFRCLLPYFLLLKNYLPLYFYGNTEERYGTSNLFPYLFCTKQGVLQISAKEDMAILHTDPDVIQTFRKLFSQISKNCQQLGTVFSGLGNEMNWYMSFLSRDMFQDCFELCTGLCSTQFWDRTLIEKYINPSLPNLQETIDALVDFCDKLHTVKQMANTTVLMNPQNVLDFIQTGRFIEYPDLFFAKPLSKEDRLALIDQIIKACHEGWFHIRLIDASAFPLTSHCWELGASQDTAILQHFHQNQFLSLMLGEHALTGDLHDYLEALSQSEYAMSEEESVELLQNWIQQYLT